MSVCVCVCVCVWINGKEISFTPKQKKWREERFRIAQYARKGKHRD